MRSIGIYSQLVADELGGIHERRITTTTSKPQHKTPSPTQPSQNPKPTQVVLYGYVRERAATTRLPWPFVPLRDGLILPCFRAVEASAQWLLSDRPVRACLCLSVCLRI